MLPRNNLVSDPELIHRNNISYWIDHKELNFKMTQPLDIDLEKISWEIASELMCSIQVIIYINMIHMKSWNFTKSLFNESNKLLKWTNFNNIWTI